MNRRLLFAALIALVAIAFAAPAFAEEFVDPHWMESPINFSAGFKFGMGFPSTDEFKSVYGEKAIPTYGIEAGWKMVHELELHGELTYWWDQGRGITTDDKQTNEKYKMHMAPAELGLIYRFNFVYDQILVPYIGVSGVYSYYLEEKLDSSWKKRGGIWGAAGKAGLMILLDGVEKRASGGLERDWGINSTYLVYHAKYTMLNNFDDQEGLDLTNWQHNFGILWEF
jgi:hypothetical protein